MAKDCSEGMSDSDMALNKIARKRTGVDFDGVDPAGVVVVKVTPASNIPARNVNKPANIWQGKKTA